MKHLLTGVAIAAALAIVAPAMAQNAPMTPSAPNAGAPAKTMPMKQAHHRMVRHHTMRHHAMMRHHGRMAMRGGGNMTEELNRQELQRLQGGPAMQAAPPPAPMQGPRPSSAH